MRLSRTHIIYYIKKLSYKLIAYSKKHWKYILRIYIFKKFITPANVKTQATAINTPSIYLNLYVR